MPTTLPEVFGRYKIQKKLGEGGMGAVYLAEDTKLRRKVALKVPHFSGSESSSVLQRFEREARMAAQIEHPNLCPIHDVDAIDGIHYITMTYIEGQPLSKMVGEDKKWAVGDALMLIRQIALALAHLHEAGIIHRDLKPANVMIRKDGNPVIMDFGLARSFQNESQQLTGTQHPLGTPAYMSPEQVMADPNAIGPRSDLYSLGVILYELLGGRLPFTGSVVQVFANILHTQPTTLGQIRPEVGPAVDALVMQTMAKNPADRPESMKAFAERLTTLLSQIGTQPDGTLVPGRGSGTHTAATLGQGPSTAGQELRQTPPGAWTTPSPQGWPTPGTGQAHQPIPTAPSWGTPAPWPTAPTQAGSQPPASWPHAAPTQPGSAGQMPVYGPPSTPPGSMPPANWTGQSGGAWQPVAQPSSMPGWAHPSGGSHPSLPAQQGRGQGVLLGAAVLIFLLCLGVSAWFIYVIVSGKGANQANGTGSTTQTSTGADTGTPTGRTAPTGPTQQGTQSPIARLELKLSGGELSIEAGKSATLSVQIVHQNLTQDVDVTLSGAPSGISAEPLRLKRDQTLGDLTIRVGDKVTPGVEKVTVRVSSEADGKPLGDSATLTLTVTARPVLVGDSFVNKVNMKMVPIKPGPFSMGSKENEEGSQEGERPAREVIIKRPFFIGAHEVTQKQFETVMGRNPSWFHPDKGGKEQLGGERDTSNYPVDSVSWVDAVEFCKKLSELPEEKALKRTYRLPTEAEWEYACRAGTTTPFNLGDKLTRSMANIDAPANAGATVAVGGFAPNAWGLYDMHGNVAEWCSDWWADDYYFKAAKAKQNVDPQGPDRDEFAAKVLRGGAYESAAKHCRSATRSQAKPSEKPMDKDQQPVKPPRNAGFRVVCVVGE